MNVSSSWISVQLCSLGLLEAERQLCLQGIKGTQSCVAARFN